jgi:hypothetical protein
MAWRPVRGNVALEQPYSAQQEKSRKIHDLVALSQQLHAADAGPVDPASHLAVATPAPKS